MLVRAVVDRTGYANGPIALVNVLDREAYFWVSKGELTTEAAIRADERRRVARSDDASDDADWVDIACRCCKSKPLMRTWKFCPTCGSDVRTPREGGAG